jgi:hypothetical protein
MMGISPVFSLFSNCLLLKAYLKAIVVALRGVQFVVRANRALPAESALICIPNLTFSLLNDERY